MKLIFSIAFLTIGIVNLLAIDINANDSYLHFKLKFSSNFSNYEKDHLDYIYERIVSLNDKVQVLTDFVQNNRHVVDNFAITCDTNIILNSSFTFKMLDKEVLDKCLNNGIFIVKTTNSHTSTITTTTTSNRFVQFSLHFDRSFSNYKVDRLDYIYEIGFRIEDKVEKVYDFVRKDKHVVENFTLICYDEVLPEKSTFKMLSDEMLDKCINEGVYVKKVLVFSKQQLQERLKLLELRFDKSFSNYKVDELFYKAGVNFMFDDKVKIVYDFVKNVKHVHENFKIVCYDEILKPELTFRMLGDELLDKCLNEGVQVVKVSSKRLFKSLVNSSAAPINFHVHFDKKFVNYKQDRLMFTWIVKAQISDKTKVIYNFVRNDRHVSENFKLYCGTFELNDDIPFDSLPNQTLDACKRSVFVKRL